MNSSEDGDDINKVPPPPRTSFVETISGQSSYLETEPPTLMPKRSSGFGRASSILDRQFQNSQTPTLLSCRNCGFVEEIINNGTPALRNLSQSVFSNSFDSGMSRILTDKEHISNLQSCSGAEVLTVTSLGKFSAPSLHSEASCDVFSGDTLETTSVQNDKLPCHTPISFSASRPVPKPRTRKSLLIRNDSGSLPLGLSSTPSPTPNLLTEQSSMRQSHSMTEFNSGTKAEQERRSVSFNSSLQMDPESLERMLGEVDKNHTLASLQNVQISGENIEMIVKDNHEMTASNNKEDDDNYVSAEDLRQFSVQGSGQSSTSPAAPKPHSSGNRLPAYVQMYSKKHQKSSSSDSFTHFSLHERSSPQYKIELGSDHLEESSTDQHLDCEHSSAAAVCNIDHTPCSPIPQPFNNIQPFQPKVLFTQCEIKQELKAHNSEQISAKSSMIITTSQGDLQGSHKSSSEKLDSDFVVDWDSAFKQSVSSDTTDVFNSSNCAMAGETSGLLDATCDRSDAISAVTPAAKMWQPIESRHSFHFEPPADSPPPLPELQKCTPEPHPPQVPRRPENAADHTPVPEESKNTNPAKVMYHQSSVNKGIFNELPTPAFSQNPSSDPFQDSNFDFECHQFNTSQVPDLPARSPWTPPVDVEASNMKEAIDPSMDPELISRFVMPPPNFKGIGQYMVDIELGRELSSSSESEVSELVSSQGWDGGPATRCTPLKVFDSSLLPKKNSRYGYLYKQGGYKANKGWKKRWVVYNGSSLSYYANNTAQVSKRIIPIRCMVNVETDVKSTDKNSFRFKVVTSLKDRVFVFSSETLDDCLTWANTIMAAITEYKKSASGADVTQEKPDREGYIKFSNIKKYYVTISGKTLCYYRSVEDYQMGSPVHEIDMKLASVKVKDHRKLQLWIHYGHFDLMFESDQDMQHWRMAMEDAIAEGLADDTVLKKVYENMSNQQCADCGVDNPHWASINLGIVVCKNCAGIHRMFDYRLSKIRSLRMDTRVWTPSLIEEMVTIGNANANAFWEFELPAGAKIQATDSMETRKEFIIKKYKNKKFCNLHPLANQGPILGEALLTAAAGDSVLEVMKVLFSGADVLYRSEESGSTAYEIAKENGHRLIMELLYQNGGDPQSLCQDVTDENQLREDVRLQGFLNKTGPVGRSFEKRWCILEHGALTYYLNEKSKTFKGSIDRKNMYLIQSVQSDRIGYSFEVSTALKDNRIFTFSSDSKDDSGEWIRTVAKLMAPVTVMDHVGMIDIKLAGYAFMKESLVDEWHQTFIVFSWRGINYVNRDLKFSYIDLRKASGIKMQDSSNGYQQKGPCFVISSTGKSIYLQATLTRDTEKMFTAFQEAILISGHTLIDQALTSENVPVIVERCITHIYMNGLEEKGIYRVGGQNSRVQALLDEFRKDAWSVSLSEYTVQDVSNVMKRFLRELDDSLFGRMNYPSWINMAGCRDVNHRLMWYKYYLEKMPEVSFQTLKRVILHLLQVSQNEKVNLMSITNLASCFAPSLMRTAKDEQPNLVSDASTKEINIIVDLMNNSDYFFNVNENERVILNNIRQAEIEIQKRIQENRLSAADPTISDILIPVHLLSSEGQSANILVTEKKTAKEAMDYLKRNKTAPELEIYVLHELLFKGELQRPLFPEDIIATSTNRWMEWEGWVMEDNNVCLCVRGLELLEKLHTHYSPNHVLLSKHQYCNSKPKSKFKRRTIGFRQCKLALYSDSKGSIECESWLVEDMTIYLGTMPRKVLPPYRYCLTFLVAGEKYLKPPFGHCISFETEDELFRWAAALYAAQHPAGILSWANQ